MKRTFAFAILVFVSLFFACRATTNPKEEVFSITEMVARLDTCKTSEPAFDVLREYGFEPMALAGIGYQKEYNEFDFFWESDSVLFRNEFPAHMDFDEYGNTSGYVKRLLVTDSTVYSKVYLFTLETLVESANPDGTFNIPGLLISWRR